MDAQHTDHSTRQTTGRDDMPASVNSLPGPAFVHSEEMIAADILTKSRRGGALYEEIFQILGPGVSPRVLAAGTWQSRPPPRHCRFLRSVRKAISMGSPLPQPDAEGGWSRDDLLYAQQGIWEQWNIGLHIRVTGQRRAHDLGRQHPATQAMATVHYNW